MGFMESLIPQKLVVQVDSLSDFYGKLSDPTDLKGFFLDGRGMNGRGEDLLFMYFILEDGGIKMWLTGKPLRSKAFFSGYQT